MVATRELFQHTLNSYDHTVLLSKGVWRTQHIQRCH